MSAFTLEAFADTEEYRKINQEMIARFISLMKRDGSQNVGSILDLATGTGLMTKLFLENAPEEWDVMGVSCLDMEKSALVAAETKLRPLLSGRIMQFVYSSIEEMRFERESFDVVLWGNGIHYSPELAQMAAFHQIREMLTRGGWFFFNTAFYSEAIPKHTKIFYRAQIHRALELLREKGITRDKKSAREHVANYFGKDYYAALVQHAGFELVEIREYSARINQDAMEAISSFRDYAAGMLRGYPVEDASAALVASVASAMREYGERDENNQPYITRNWLAVAARKAAQK